MKRFEEWTDIELEELERAIMVSMHNQTEISAPTAQDIYNWIVQEKRERREDPHQKKLGEEE